MNILFGLAYPVLLLIIAILMWSNENIRNILRKYWKQILIFAVLNFIILNAVLYFHLRQENFITYWDFGGFYRRTVEFADMLDRSLSEAVDNLIVSINTAEYNYIAEWFLYIPVKLVGNTYPRFILAMANSFLIPANTVLYILALSILDKLSVRKNSMFFVGILIACFSSNIYPMVHGYIGSAGLVFIAAITLFIYHGCYEKLSIREDFFIGLSLILLLLIRRWYAYYIVGFFIALPAAYIAANWKKFEKKKTWIFILNYGICGLIPLQTTGR